jgi:hypothetical protein
MIIDEMTDLLVAAGFDTGWVLSGGKLVLWEHEENPPLPLTRPE